MLVLRRIYTTSSTTTSSGLSASLMRWRLSKSPFDLSCIKRALMTNYEYTNGTTLPSGEVGDGSVAELLVMIRSDIAASEALTLLQERVSFALRFLSSPDLILSLSAFATESDLTECSPIMSEIVKELESESRTMRFSETVNWPYILLLMKTLDSIEYKSTHLLRICAELLIPHLPDMSPDQMSDMLTCMQRFQLRHKKLLDAISRAIFVIPCSNKELEKLANSLTKLDGGSAYDRSLLLRLVKFRNAEILQ